MANLRAFLQTLDKPSYTEEKLRELGTTFELNEDQIEALVSHDSKKIGKAIKDHDSDHKDVKGLALRVVM